MKLKRGFTLTELLIVIGITIIVAAATIPIYGNLQISAQLNDNTAQIVQIIREAREMSMSRYNNSSHGVQFNPSNYVLYQGNSYLTRDNSYDRQFVLDNPLTLTPDLGGSDVNFSKGLGVPNATGTITLSHDVEGVRQIIINDLGIVEEN